MSEPADVPVLKHPTILRVWLGHLMEPAALREAVAEHRSRVEAQFDEVREDRRVVDRPTSRWPTPSSSSGWAERYYSAELDNTNQLLDDLDERQRQPARS